MIEGVLMGSRMYREVQVRFRERSVQTCYSNVIRRHFPTLHERRQGGVIESIGTDAKFTSKYGGNGCPDKSANGMFTYAKNKGCAWGTA